MTSLGNSIIQAARPRSVIAPLQLGLAIQMHNHFGSKFLIDTLDRLGFSSSYCEVQMYEMSAAATEIPDAKGLSNGESIQFVADNVDHNIRTLDGHGTLNGKGMISGVTPGKWTETSIERKHVSAADLLALAKVDIKYMKEPSSRLSTMTYTQHRVHEKEETSNHVSLLCILLWPKVIVGWSGICRVAANGPFPGKSSFEFLPMIDLDPGNPSLHKFHPTLHPQ